jgi:hypothetical protein
VSHHLHAQSRAEQEIRPTSLQLVFIAGTIVEAQGSDHINYHRRRWRPHAIILRGVMRASTILNCSHAGRIWHVSYCLLDASSESKQALCVCYSADASAAPSSRLLTSWIPFPPSCHCRSAVADTPRCRTGCHLWLTAYVRNLIRNHQEPCLDDQARVSAS